MQCWKDGEAFYFYNLNLVMVALFTACQVNMISENWRLWRFLWKLDRAVKFSPQGPPMVLWKCLKQSTSCNITLT